MLSSLAKVSQMTTKLLQKELIRNDGIYGKQEMNETINAIRDTYDMLEGFVINNEGSFEEEIHKLLLHPNEKEPFLKEHPHTYLNYTKHILQVVLSKITPKRIPKPPAVEGSKHQDYDLLMQDRERVIFQLNQRVKELIIANEGMQIRYQASRAHAEFLEKNSLRLIEELQKDNKDLLRVIDERDIDIHNLKAEIGEDQEIIKKQEKKIVSIPVLEHKVRSLEKDFATNLHHIKAQHHNEVTNLKRVLEDNNDQIQGLQRHMAASPAMIKATLGQSVQWQRAAATKPNRVKSKSFFPYSPARLLVSPTPNSPMDGGLSMVRTPLSSRSKLS